MYEKTRSKIVFTFSCDVLFNHRVGVGSFLFLLNICPSAHIHGALLYSRYYETIRAAFFLMPKSILYLSETTL